MRPDSTLTASPSLSPVTAPRHAPACPRCRGRLVQLEDPTCLPCGWADYRTPGLCGICRDPMPPGRTRFCSDSCVGIAGGRRKALAARTRVDRGRCVRCGIPADATYCPRHKLAVRDAAIDWRARRRAAGRCLKCSEPSVNSTHCELHRQQHNAEVAARRLARLAARRCRQCGEPATGTFCELHRQRANARAS